MRRVPRRLTALLLLLAGVLLVTAITPVPATRAAPVLDQAVVPPSFNNSVFAAVGANGLHVSAQTFTAGLSGPLVQVDLLLQGGALNDPPLGPVVEITTVADGVPTTTVLASTTIPPQQVPATFQWVSVAFAQPATVVSRQSYAIVVRPPAGAQFLYQVFWGITSGAYAGGAVMRRLNTDPWNLPINGDAGFRTFVDLPPTLTSVSPRSGPEAGGTVVTITGLALTGATAVHFGTRPATSFTVTSDTEIAATAPPGTGTISVQVTSPDGASADTPADDYTYLPLPTVTSITPHYGPAGGAMVTIVGTGFSTTPGQTSFAVIDTASNSHTFTGVSCSVSTTCTATAPANPAAVLGTAANGRLVATVTGAGSSSAAGPYFVWWGPPRLLSLSPATGPAAGGTTVQVVGDAFPNTLSAAQGQSAPVTVTFGSTPIALATGCQSIGVCTVTAPPGTGTVDVTITTPGGISNARSYTYLAAAPTVTSLSPSAGLNSGGGPVTITGSGFSTTPGATTVRFGSATATTVVCAGTTSCTATAPPGSGLVDVRVTVAGQQSANTPADNYTYVVPDATAMTFYGNAVVNGGPPPTGALLQAFVGSVLCGQTTVGGGPVQFQVVGAGQIPGCGTDGVAVRFTIGGQPATAQPPVLFRSGGLAKALLYVGAPPAPLPPLQVTGTVTRGGLPMTVGQVQAVVNGVVCGTAAVKSGSFTLSVAANPPQAGCGMAGDPVSFRVDGVAVAGTVSFTAGATATVALTLP